MSIVAVLVRIPLTGGLTAIIYFTITGTEYNAPVRFYFSHTLAGGLPKVICLCVGMVVTDDCVDIPAAANFTMSTFQGRWYEIGKIQTAGGAFFQRECVCNSLFVEPDTTKTNGDGKVHYSCRKNVPTGDYMNMTADLTDMKAPGKWNQQFFWYVPKVSWTVIIQGEDYAIEYDCGGTLFGLITNYCIHVMSRKPTQDPAVTQKLIEFAEGLGLNPYKLPFERIKHDGCW